MELTGKIFSRTSLLAAVKQIRRSKPRVRIVFTNGVFDILHAGHVTYLQKARALGDYLVVGMNSDQSVRRLKGPTRPIQTERDRAKILSALRAVDAVVIFSEQTPLRLIQGLKPDVLVKGADYTMSQIVGATDVLSNGGIVKRIKLVSGRSTTGIVRKMKT